VPEVQEESMSAAWATLEDMHKMSLLRTDMTNEGRKKNAALTEVFLV